ncbi:MAG: ubiquinol-cytochrome C chaperone [Proteobacteria bacterium]|nr:ubiquinol-cytochrome C chaperone [Pseudomonadota bacterium]
MPSVNGFWKRSKQVQGERLCFSALNQARQPIFYTNWEVPDSLEGRFDCASLHVALLLRHLKGSLAQVVFDIFFAYTELTLREVGVGDLSVGKQIKKCAQFFYGSMKSYHDALENKTGLEESLIRNLYGGNTVSLVHEVADHIRKCDQLLAQQNLENATLIKWS